MFGILIFKIIIFFVKLKVWEPYLKTPHQNLWFDAGQVKKLIKLMKILAENKKAYFDYQILDKFEVGIALLGQEVKSLKIRGVNLAGSYVIVKNEELFWVGAKIPAYQPKNAPSDYQPERSRKLLLRKNEIKKLLGKSKEKGLTLIPLRVYSKNAKIKLEFGTAKGKKKIDKREIIKKREFERERERFLKGKLY